MQNGLILNLLPVRGMSFYIDIKTYLHEVLMAQHCAHLILALVNSQLYNSASVSELSNDKAASGER